MTVFDATVDGNKVYEVADALIERDVPVLFGTGNDRSDIPSRYAKVPSCQKPVGADEVIAALERLIQVIPPRRPSHRQASDSGEPAATPPGGPRHYSRSRIRSGCHARSAVRPRETRFRRPASRPESRRRQACHRSVQAPPRPRRPARRHVPQALPAALHGVGDEIFILDQEDFAVPQQPFAQRSKLLPSLPARSGQRWCNAPHRHPARSWSSP